MTERDRREGTGETRDNVQDDLDEASKGRKGRKEGATTDAVEREAASGGDGGVKDNVRDEHEETQRH